MMDNKFKLSILLDMLNTSEKTIPLPLTIAAGNKCSELPTFRLTSNLGIFKAGSDYAKVFADLNQDIKTYNDAITEANKGKLEEHKGVLSDKLDSIFTKLEKLKSATVDECNPGKPKEIAKLTVTQHKEKLEGIIKELHSNVDKIELSLAEQMSNLLEITADLTQIKNFDDARKYLSQLQAEKREAKPYQLTRVTAKELGELMIDTLKAPGDSAVRHELLNMLSQEKSSWGDKEKTIARCLACSTAALDSITDATIVGQITTMREDYDLTFPSNTEYDAYFSKFLTDHTLGGAHDLDLDSLPNESKVHIILCDSNSKTDVINATEQYMRKLQIKGTIAAHSAPNIKLVKSQQELETALTQADLKNMNVSFTNISHGTGETMGYVDLAPKLRLAIIKYASAKTLTNKTALEAELRANAMDDFCDMIDELVPIEPDGERSSASVALDNFRQFNANVGEEPKVIAELINKHLSINRVRMLACTSAGFVEKPAKNLNMLELNLNLDAGEDEKKFGGRATKKIVVEFPDTIEDKKIAKVSKLVERPGVIIKGERGIINPGVGGILRYDSEIVGREDKLYQQKAGAIAQGGSVAVIKAPLSDPANEKTSAILIALDFLKHPEKIVDAEAQAKAAQLVLVELKASDLPAGWKLKYVQAINMELEKHISALPSLGLDE